MLGDNIRKIRKLQGISINKLSKISGVSLGYLSDLENNKSLNPTRDTLEKLAEALHTTIDEFFKELDVEIKKNNDKSIQENLPVIPEEFTDPKEARSYVDKHQIFGSSGFDADNLSDEEILEFANELLRQMEIISYKYKK